VSEKYYALNEAEAKLDGEDWNKVSSEEKLNYISYYQLSLMTQYQNYLKKLEENGLEDNATFSVLELMLDEKHFNHFQNELNELMNKYYKAANKSNEKEAPVRTIAITIIPDA
ncbi:MAG TPA: transcriptional regulator, partial [Metabacillus sp.]|nr:transcriptional regulator [Metabacillus sp.]